MAKKSNNLRYRERIRQRMNAENAKKGKYDGLGKVGLDGDATKAFDGMTDEQREELIPIFSSSAKHLGTFTKKESDYLYEDDDDENLVESGDEEYLNKELEKIDEELKDEEAEGIDSQDIAMLPVPLTDEKFI